MADEVVVLGGKALTRSPSVLILRPKRVAGVLAAVACLLVALSVALDGVKYFTGDHSFYGLIPLFNVRQEANIPSFFSGCLFLVDAMLLLLVWHIRRLHRGPRATWLCLAGLFVFLSFDELFSVHERFTGPLRATFHTSGPLFYAWVLLYGAAVILLAAAFWPTWRRLESIHRRWLALSAALYLAGALGLEMVGVAHLVASGMRGDLWFGLLYTMEESLEMAGLITFAYALMFLAQDDNDGCSIVIPGAGRHRSVAPPGN